MHDASVNLNNDDIEVQGSLDLGELNQSDYPDIYFLTLGLLDADNKEKTDPLLSAGFMLRQNLRGAESLKIGIGIKGTYTEVGNAKHATVPINAELSYVLPIDSVIPFMISGSVSYAPPVLSFKDADRYFEGRAELSLQIVEQGSLFVGYRQIKTDFIADGYKFNDTGYVGFKVRF
jgi:hypothetical protein